MIRIYPMIHLRNLEISH